jgi:hypothetical protein
MRALWLTKITVRKARAACMYWPHGDLERAGERAGAPARCVDVETRLRAVVVVLGRSASEVVVDAPVPAAVAVEVLKAFAVVGAWPRKLQLDCRKRSFEGLGVDEAGVCGGLAACPVPEPVAAGGRPLPVVQAAR